MGTTGGLGEFEQLVILAVLRLEEDAYGVAIRTEIEQRTNRTISRGAVYTTLDRMESKGLLSSRRSEEPGPGTGVPRRYYRVEPEGLDALQEARSALQRMWAGLEPSLGEL